MYLIGRPSDLITVVLLKTPLFLRTLGQKGLQGIKLSWLQRVKKGLRHHLLKRATIR